MAATKEAYGRVDGLVDNAGVLRFNALVDTPRDEFTRVVQVNQVGVFLGLKTLAPSTRQLKKPGEYGEYGEYGGHRNRPW